MPRLPAGYYKVERRNKDGTTRAYFVTRFYKFDAAGRRKRVYVYGATLDDVKSKRHRLEVRRIGSFSAEKEPLTTILDRWLVESNRDRAWSPRTLSLNTYLVEKHVEPYLGATPLAKLSRDTLASYWDALPVGSRTRQQVYHILRSVFASAIESDLITANPVGRPPKHRYRQFRSLTREEASRLLNAASTTRHYGLIYLALVTAMREGELFGLKWEHIDFQNQFISVSGTLTRKNGSIDLRPPKRGRYRRVDLSANDITVLTKHREIQSKNFDVPWVFTDTQGNPLQRHNFMHRDWKSLLEHAEIGPLRFYDLRHTSTTLALAAGVPVKVLQERLGHASAKMTLDVYAKVVPSLQANAAQQMSVIFGDWCTSWCTRAGDEGKNVVK